MSEGLFWTLYLIVGFLLGIAFASLFPTPEGAAGDSAFAVFARGMIVALMIIVWPVVLFVLVCGLITVTLLSMIGAIRDR